MKKLILTAAIFGASASGLFADTVAYLQSAGPTSQTDGSYAVSPYTGNLGITSYAGSATHNTDGSVNTGVTSVTGGIAGGVQLFCDDFPDHAVFGQTWNAQVTGVTSSDSTSLTRFGASNPNAFSYPAGTALYEELAWLFNQTANNNESAANQIAIQEAVWHLTDAPGATPTASSTNTGTNLTYLQWITAAAADSTIQADGKSKVTAGFATATYSQWYVVTADNYKTAGSTQEFLAYNAAGGITGTTHSASPEPATFALFGGGLLAVGFFARKRKQSNS